MVLVISQNCFLCAINLPVFWGGSIRPTYRQGGPAVPADSGQHSARGS